MSESPVRRLPPLIPRSHRRTDMVGAGATYAPQESIAGLIKVIEKLGPIDNGRFHDFKGNPIPWYWTPFRHRARPAKCWSIDALQPFRSVPAGFAPTASLPP